MRRLRRWTKEEVEKLKKLYPDSSVSVKKLEEVFGRNFKAIQQKALRLGLYRSGRNPEYVGMKLKGKTVSEKLLEFLKKKDVPVSGKEVSRILGVSEGEVIEAVEKLRKEGYDVKEIYGRERLYVLVRFGDWTSEQYYRILGEVSTPILLTGDWHVGSKNFSKLALKEMVKDVEEYGIRDVLIAGDLLQGLGVHKVELMDLSITSISEQVEEAVKLLKMFPEGTRFHLVLGNHEEKLKGKHKVGFDALKSVSEKTDNCFYYGSVATLKMDRDFTLMMIHMSGTPSYAVSYKLQRFFEQLIERPNVIVAGHFHQLMVLPKPPAHLLIFPGTLQRENRFLLSKGYTSQVGWVILETFTPEQCNVIIRTPEVY